MIATSPPLGDQCMRTYISIDVAVRSLAIGVYRMRPFRNIDSFRDDDPRVMNANLNSIIDPLLMKVIDINDGSKTKDTTIEAKAIILKSTLCAIDTEISALTEDPDITVLIEYQMNANHGANAIFNMILYHYAGRYPIEVMKPSWKNTISVHPKLTHAAFLGAASSNYIANKRHTRYTMLYLLTAIDRMDAIEGIANKNQDDIADTLCQCIAFHLR